VDKAAQVTVEFYGIPRHRAGRSELVVSAATVAESLAAVERACPGLADLIRPDGKLAPHYLLSVNGETFVKDVRQALSPGDHLLVLSADAGG
jgi:molybdopterin converting factor small subunit